MNHEDTKALRKAKRRFERIPLETERIATEIVDSAFTVHTEMVPGLLESVYEACLVKELELRGLKVDRQIQVPLKYKGESVGESFKLDLLVEGVVICELKAVLEMHPVYKAQLMSYLKLSGQRLGFLINFNVERIKDGITRIVL
jgi:GxxExxY protein